MANGADILKEFLISLGFEIDKSAEQKFKSSVAEATVKVVALGTAVAATATAITVGVAKIADEFEKLYFVSKRTNSTVANIQSLGFAMQNMGSSVESATGSLENLARFLRNSPGAEGLLKNIGIQTRDANGNMRDTVEIVNDLGKTFADMPYYKANAYAQALGIDEKTLMALRENVGGFQQQYKEMLDASGFDAHRAAESSHAFMVELRTLGAAFTILTQKIGTGLTGVLGSNLKKLRESLVANFDRIAGVISYVLDFVLKLSAAIGALAFRGIQALTGLMDWFNGLSDSTQTVLKWVGLIGAAWKLLNLGFLATPLGIITTLITSLALLWDDYQTWKEGGKSLIDWDKWAPGIEAAIDGMKRLKINFNLMIDAMRITIQPLMKYVDELIQGVEKLLSWTGLSFSKNSAPQSAPAPAVTVTPSTSSANIGTGTRGIRNNNPGNLNYVGQTGATKEQGPGGRFAVFGTPQEGLDALAKQLQLYGKRGVDTTQSIIGKFAPPNENNTRSYINTVAKNLGVGPETRLNLKDPVQLASVMDAIIKVENGKNPYTSEMLTTAASKSVGGGAPTSINQTTTITVNGSTDPSATAKDVSVAQNSVNERLVRNMRSVVFQ